MAPVEIHTAHIPASIPADPSLSGGQLLGLDRAVAPSQDDGNSSDDAAQRLTAAGNVQHNGDSVSLESLSGPVQLQRPPRHVAAPAIMSPLQAECGSLETTVSSLETTASSLETRVSSLKSSVSSLKSMFSSLKTDTADLRGQLARQQRQIWMIARAFYAAPLRALADEACAKLYGAALPDEMRGDEWNAYLENLKDSDYEGTGLTRADWTITSFIRRTVLRSHNSHQSLDLQWAAEAVCAPQHRKEAWQKLFRYVTGEDPETFISEV